MAVDSFTPEKMQPIDDCTVVSVPLNNVRVPRSKMSCQETKRCVVVFQPNAYCAFVARHTPQASL